MLSLSWLPLSPHWGLVATCLPFTAVAINIRDPKSLVSYHLVRRHFWMLFTCCNKADGCEICLPSFPSLRVMLVQGDEGEGARGYPRSRHPSRTAGLMPGLGLPWTRTEGRFCPLANWGQSNHRIPRRCSQVMGKHLHLRSPPA